MSQHPQLVLVFCGKRKSGKDYVTEVVQQRIGEHTCAILRLSAPLKEQYAKEHDLDFSRLLDASEYKEKYRSDMIRWGEEKRNKDPGFFCRVTCSGPESHKSVWIISDARRKTDVEYFRNTYPQRVLTIRIEAKESVRQNRGWKFTEGVDDAESECGLDSGVDFDFVFHNNGIDSEFEQTMQTLLNMTKERMSEKL